MTKLSFSQKTFKSMKVVEQTMRNSCIFVSLVIISAVLFVIMLGFNTLAANPNLIKGGPFNRSIGNISDNYPLNITPAGWAFSIWGLIYLMVLGSTLYSLGLLCRVTENGQPAYTSPAVLSPLYYVLFSLSCILNVGWLLLWDKLMFSASLLFLASTVLVLWCAVSIVSTRLVFFRSDLIDSGRKLDVNVIEVFIINGLGMYATWSTIATLINLGVAAVYRWQDLKITDETASIICLAILSLLVIIYAALDLTVFDRYTRFTFTPYATVIWALSAIISKNWDTSNRSSIISVILLGSASVLCIVKIALVIYRLHRVSNPYRRLKFGAVPKLTQK